MRPRRTTGRVARSLRAGALVLLGWAEASGAPGPLVAQETRPITVRESVRLGLEHSPRLRIARAEAEAAAAAWRQRRSRLLPSIEANASYTRLSGNVDDARFMVPGVDTALTLLPVERDRFLTELRLEQPLFAGLRLRNETRAAEHRARAAQAMTEQATADLALDIRRAYWELRAAEATLTAVEASVAHLERLLEGVRRQVEEGAALRRDLLMAETRHAEVLLERVEADHAIRVGRLELNRLLGLPLDTPLEPVDTVAVGPSVADIDQLAAAVLETRPEIRALERSVDASRAGARAARGHWFPELSLLGRYVYARPNQYFFTEQDRFRGNWELGLSARVNLFQGGLRPALTREADAVLAEAEARLSEAREIAVVRVTGHHLEARRGAEAVEVARRAVVSAEEAFRVASEQFDEGAALSQDVLEAEEALREALARQARATAEYAVARAALLNALGRVW